MMDVEQIQAAVAIVEQKLKEENPDNDAGFIGAVGTLLIAAIGSLASISNSLQIIQRDLEMANRIQQQKGVSE